MAIDHDRIVEEALLLLNEVGIDKLSTRKLADRLGVQQPALYWHFKNKSALLDALNSAMLARFHTRRMPLPGEDWVDFTLANGSALAEVAPFPILSAAVHSMFAAGTINTEPVFEAGLRFMVDGMQQNLQRKQAV